ncbi:hypothetical protein RXV86_09345 [Alisedimentitalea sp. MJ-SS2]|uniref:hypothetical protein n=1 Tax=Aliisedimentitalea sp. MJ-SS2 TaxID=3049795 RepID=UPI00290C06D0|nr:hypothetical protein [Alisedimentitalea sp. MJ-SS2]MDU8927587.1 hypothetical protein [Alisedimentitalea sp. MJ-SS2]
MTPDFDARITFHDDLQTMEADFSNFDFPSPALVNAFYDRIESRIRETGEDKWFFLVNYSHCRIDSSAWVAFSRRGKALNMAHSMGSVRFDVSDATRKQIERDAKTERFDPNLFADRDSALARIKTFDSVRRKKIVHTPSHTPEEIARRITFDPDVPLMEADFSNFTFMHSRDVDDVYDHIEGRIKASDRKWFFLVNMENCEIHPGAWVRYAHRGKRLNIAASLGSVRFAPGSETEVEIRDRAESQGFRPNIRNTREEALERIAEMKAELIASMS